MNTINDLVTVVIRSVGERTESLCRELILAQGIDPARVATIRESPFSAALRVSFTIGIEQGRPWTCCVDADVLLRPDAVNRMLAMAARQPANVCEIQGYILDKFFGGPRYGGVHLYRTALLPLARSVIPAEGLHIRPEFNTLKAMRDRGHPWVVVPYLVGLHDFEQYNRDIFRKSVVHAHKNLDYAEMLISFWRERADRDADCRVALAGFARGVAYRGEVRIDDRQDVYRTTESDWPTDEKEPIAEGAHTLESIERTITEWIEPESYRRKCPTACGLREEAPPLPFAERMRRRVRGSGVLGATAYVAGWLLRHAGAGLQALGQRLQKIGYRSG